MKSFKKRILSFGLVFSLVLSCFVVTGPVKTPAAEKSYMQRLKLKELKTNGKYKIKTYVDYTNAKQTSTYYITNLKKTNAKKKGYKKLTFTFIVEPSNIKYSSSAIHGNANNGTAGGHLGYYYAIVDNTTGKDLEEDNDVDVTVVYPESYKDLGIIVGAYDNSTRELFFGDDSFWSGEKAFGKSSYYKYAKEQIRPGFYPFSYAACR